MRPLMAELVVKALHMTQSTVKDSKSKLVVLSDDVHGDREASRPQTSSSIVPTTKAQLRISRGRWGVVLEDPKFKAALLQASPRRVAQVSALERYVYSTADGVLAITDEDRDRMWALSAASPGGEFGNTHFYTLRPSVQIDENMLQGGSFPTFKERSGFIFVGTGQVNCVHPDLFSNRCE